jgi:hypothetical protein
MAPRLPRCETRGAMVDALVVIAPREAGVPHLLRFGAGGALVAQPLLMSLTALGRRLMLVAAALRRIPVLLGALRRIPVLLGALRRVPVLLGAFRRVLMLLGALRRVVMSFGPTFGRIFAALVSPPLLR